MVLPLTTPVRSVMVSGVGLVLFCRSVRTRAGVAGKRRRAGCRASRIEGRNEPLVHLGLNLRVTAKPHVPPEEIDHGGADTLRSPGTASR